MLAAYDGADRGAVLGSVEMAADRTRTRDWRWPSTRRATMTASTATDVRTDVRSALGARPRSGSRLERGRPRRAATSTSAAPRPVRLRRRVPDAAGRDGRRLFARAMGCRGGRIARASRSIDLREHPDWVPLDGEGRPSGWPATGSSSGGASSSAPSGTPWSSRARRLSAFFGKVPDGRPRPGGQPPAPPSACAPGQDPPARADADPQPDVRHSGGPLARRDADAVDAETGTGLGRAPRAAAGPRPRLRRPDARCHRAPTATSLGELGIERVGGDQRRPDAASLRAATDGPATQGTGRMVVTDDADANAPGASRLYAQGNAAADRQLVRAAAMELAARRLSRGTEGNSGAISGLAVHDEGQLPTSGAATRPRRRLLPSVHLGDVPGCRRPGGHVHGGPDRHRGASVGLFAGPGGEHRLARPRQRTHPADHVHRDEQPAAAASLVADPTAVRRR